jgi:ubiquitin carboxyl-terminal hydrolase 4/11/15
MIVADVYNHRFHKIFALSDALSNILDRDDIFM